MSPRKRKWITRLIVGGVLGVATAAAWWSQKAATDPDSVPAIVNRDVWPWARWMLLAVVLIGGYTVSRRWVRARLPGRMQKKSTHEKAAKATAGLAGWWEIFRVSGWWSLHANARVLRPLLTAEMPWWRVWLIPSRQLGIEVAKVHFDGVFKVVQRVFARVQENTLFLGPTQSGKTQVMATIVTDHDGAVLVTSTNPNIVEQTIALRRWTRPSSWWSWLPWRRRPSPMERPVAVFNPLGVGNVPSTFRWQLLIGCKEPMVAIERAGDLMAGSAGMDGVGNREFWESQGVSLLGRLLHAAALGEQTPMDVWNWVNDPDGSRRQVCRFLGKSPAGDSWVEAHQGFVDTNNNTRSSITTTVKPALAWLQDPQLAATVMGDPDEQFDVTEWLSKKGTVYLLAEERAYSSIAPLFTAFTSYVYSECKDIASKSLGGRLDPPVRLVLDEAKNICPVPLQRWATDSAGRGIGIDVGLQSTSQLYEKWGQLPGKTIWNNLTCKAIFGGFDDPDDLRRLSDACGTVREQDEQGNWQDRRIVPMAQISQLPQWHVLILRRSMRATFGRVTPVKDRRDVRAANRKMANASVTAPAQWSPAEAATDQGKVDHG